MPPRASGQRENQRPLSAIFIGTSSASAGHAASSTPLPDLPEPPSPSGSSAGSGLPSPPATNSTGGSSTGDPATVALRRPMSTSTTTPSPGSSRSSSRLSANDDEHTMRLRIAGGSSNEVILQRARSLQQRNRIQLDKFARHSMPPDPAQVLSGSETEREGDSAIYHSTSSAGSRSSKVRLASAPSSPHRTRGSANSGTTRRKRVSLVSINNFDDDDSSDREHDYNNDERMAKDRERYQDLDRYQVGAARDRIRDIQRDDRPSARPPANSLTKSPITAARRRSALPREFLEGSVDEPPTDPQTPLRPTATTSAPSSSNMSTTTTTLSRRAAFRGSRLSDDYHPSSLAYSTREFASPRAHTTPINASTSTLATPTSSSATPATPASTKSSHNTSDSYSNSPTILARSNTLGRHAQRERRQSLRGGSAESVLGAGRSLVGEGLRAAGLSRRTVGFGGTLRERERDSESMAIRERELERMNMASRSTNRSRHVSVDLRLSHSPEREEPLLRHLHRRALPESSSEFGEVGSRTLPPRASTSMADYSYSSQSRMSTVDSEDSDEEVRSRSGRRKGLHKAAYGVVVSSREASLTRREKSLLERERELSKRERELERERAGSVIGRHHTGDSTSTASSSTQRERAGPFATLRRNPGSSSQTQSEHAKLMVDSLNMFESQLSKLTPVLGSSAGTTHAELLSRNAQSLVVNAERLNAMLRSGNSRALDAQIEAEVEDDYIPTNLPPPSLKNSNLVDVWRKIGGEYREGLRVSDDLVRAVTGLLLGVGRVMKEYVYLQNGGGSSYAGSEVGSNFGGSPLAHGRSISVGEDDVRSTRSGGVTSPDGGGTSRRSWEPLPALNTGGGSTNTHATGHAAVSTGSREEALRRLAGVRPDSPLTRASPAFHAVRELDRLETASPGVGGGLGLPKVNIPPVRRLFSPSQQREMAIVHASSTENSPAADGDEYAGGNGYEPSPTPLSRTRGGELNVPVQRREKRLPRSPLQTAQEVTLERAKTVALPPSSSLTPTTTYETPLRRNLTGGRMSRTSMTMGNDDDDHRGGENVSKHERRKISIASIATIRAVASSSSPLASGDGTTPVSVSSGKSSSHHSIPHHPSGIFTKSSEATTAVTLDNGVVISSPISVARTDSGATSTTTNTTNTSASTPTTTTTTNSSSASGVSGSRISTSTNTSSVNSSSTKPTFSRPELGGLSGLQQQLEGYKKRMESESGGAHLVDQSVNGVGGGNGKRRVGASNNANSSVMISPDSEREMRRNTYGVRTGVNVTSAAAAVAAGGGGRVSLESNGERRRRVESNNSVVDLNDSPTTAAAKREKRRTVTDIWSRG